MTTHTFADAQLIDEGDRKIVVGRPETEVKVGDGIKVGGDLWVVLARDQFNKCFRGADGKLLPGENWAFAVRLALPEDHDVGV